MRLYPSDWLIVKNDDKNFHVICAWPENILWVADTIISEPIQKLSLIDQGTYWEFKTVTNDTIFGRKITERMNNRIKTFLEQHTDLSVVSVFEAQKKLHC